MSAGPAYALISAGLVTAASLVGVALMALGERRLGRTVPLLVALAAGALLGDAFIHLLPEAFARGDRLAVSLAALGGLLAFFTLEKVLHWRHEHAPARVAPVGVLNLVGDGVHNLLDGLLIGAAYSSSVTAGVATTAAVFLHEVPQEIGDFGVLVHAGYSRWRALLYNALSGALAFAGVALALAAGEHARAIAVMLVPIAAGSFIYIAGTDLLPELKSERAPGRSLAQLTAVAAGIALMASLTLLDA